MRDFSRIELEATRMGRNSWVVRPIGQLGTCGFHPRAWTAIFVMARTAEDAITKAMMVDPKKNVGALKRG